MSGLLVHQAGPACTVQDLGRPGFLGQGLSRGGAADRLALAEGAALLGQEPGLAALEIAGFGGVFEAACDLRIALTGAPMAAEIDGARVAWNASHALRAGQRLSLGAVRAGCYGYLHLGGGIATPEVLGARAVHLAAGLGRAVVAGDLLPVGPDRGGETGLCLEVEDRFSGGVLRVVEGMQTPLFAPQVRARFEATGFTRGARANRMGVALDCPGAGFAAEGQLAILSEVIVPGDIQMTGDGRPFVLLPECQTTGGYPRIGTVIPCDLPRVAQAPAGAPLRFRFVSRAVALEAEARQARHLAELPRAPRPLVRHPGDIPDLLGYQLISGAISAHHDQQGDSE
ncbi:urea amidolyase [Aquicoccus sp. SU-CL01552]|uniref:5-oxoprolinase subunit C family protein n=1 Tax=Aquicoccus sp. SU-CL01552 TaxID=3127656 RepID=UPI0031033D2B